MKYYFVPPGKDMPDRIYRYIPLNPHKKDEIQNSKIYFNSANGFNDPYESQVSIMHEKPMRERSEKVKRAAAICCFSARNNNFPLWSYYADGLKGVCIEYDTKKLVESLSIQSVDKKGEMRENTWLYVVMVHYVTPDSNNDYGKIPEININNYKNVSTPEATYFEYQKIFSTKASFFAAEEEIRLIALPHMDTFNCIGKKSYGISNEAITGVTFGELTEPDDIRFIKEQFTHRVKYSTAIRHPKLYAIVIRE